MGLDERVLYIDRTVARELLIWPGFTKADVEKLSLLQQRAKAKARRYLEDDPSKLQLVPYALVRSMNRVFVYRRAAAHTEKRLANKWSLGVGGHTKEDETVVQALKRELCEEVSLCSQDDYTFKFEGFLLDSSTPVSMVHLGVVFSVFTNPSFIEVDGSEIAEYNFVEIPMLDAYQLESWSEILKRALQKGEL